MDTKLTVPPLQKKPAKPKKFLIVALVLVLLAAIGVGLYILTQRQISTKSRADVIRGPSCKDKSATCSWDASEGGRATSYSYSIKDKTADFTVISSNTTTTSVSFTPVAGHVYDCIVEPVNACGKGPSAAGTGSCVALNTPTPTEAPTPTPSDEPTPSVEITPTPSEEVSQTPTPTLTPTPTSTGTPTPGPSATPTPTPTPTLTPTPTNGPTATPGPSSTPTPTETIVAQSATATPEPTLPSVGSSTGMYFMIVSSILVITLFLVF